MAIPTFFRKKPEQIRVQVERQHVGDVLINEGLARTWAGQREP